MLDFRGINQGALPVLPGDQIKISFTVSNHQRRDVRLVPDLNAIVTKHSIANGRFFPDASTPRPLLPCDDYKVADEIRTENLRLTCTGEEIVTLLI